MYKVKMDGQIPYYPGDKEAVLVNPILNLQAGYAGTFESTIPPNNPLYSKIRNRNSMVSVFQDSKEIFYLHRQSTTSIGAAAPHGRG